MDTDKEVKEIPDQLLAPTMEQELALIDRVIENLERRKFFDLSKPTQGPARLLGKRKLKKQLKYSVRKKWREAEAKGTPFFDWSILATSSDGE